MQYGQNQKRSQPVSTQLERGVCSKKHKAKTRKGKKKKIITPKEHSRGVTHSSKSHLKGQLVQ